jgi:hypothetical protein
MSRKPQQPASRKPTRRRQNRPRPTPRWLKTASEEDAIAKRRCLMMLSVLSGALPVTEAIAQADISRATYYKLETRALQAMLSALTPGAEETSTMSGPTHRMAELEAKVARLEKDKRRSERLLFLTRQVLRPGQLTTGAGRPRRNQATSSGSTGKSSSRPSKRATPPKASMPKTASEAGPSTGSAS